MGTLALIGLGGNLGDRKATLDKAVAGLARVPGVTVEAVSSYHETAPIGGPEGQGAFLNAAARVRTTLEPLALLRCLHEVERQAGRVREVRWGARTLDLDLLVYGDRSVSSPSLVVPHPRLGVRRFVLAPLAEIAPRVLEVRSGLTIAQLLANLDRRPSYLALAGVDGPLKADLYDRLVRNLGAEGLDLRRAEGDFGRYANLRLLLDRESWPSGRGGEGWLVSEFCPLELARAGSFVAIEEFRAGFFEEPSLRFPGGGRPRQYLRPTFAVALDGEVEAGSGFPWLRPESTEPDAILAEILAACAASRGV